MSKLQISRKGQSGVMLLEALIAILIFSIGILAAVGMQSIAIKNVTESRARSEASFLAGELLAQMWMDQNVNVNNVNTSNVTAANYNYGGTGSPPTRLTAWVAKVSNKLPVQAGMGPKVTITNAGPTGATVQIQIFWQGPEEASLGAPPHSHTVMGAVQVAKGP